ncbi:hypothetical protein NA56DRAFT_706561 [Hyaloscypha hepaticicola]|uniref:Uncharacterized protein n=1 Tax=Hyaloscypha hepaticicola TaxID=2082293 RepID=A0A2J6PX95_9HELO|nr:hypothetical protein NA56DRAFT_706561 [Hyaloscypha hepaticicola]
MTGNCDSHDAVGRYFQIRDQHMNLISLDYAKQKGVFEDLDEGKYTLALIHAMETAPKEQKSLLRNILTQRRIKGNPSSTSNSFWTICSIVEVWTIL